MAYVLKQSNPAATTDADLYTVPAGKESVVSTIAVCNHAATTATFRVMLRDDGDTAADVHRLVWDQTVSSNDTLFVTAGITLGATDVITVYASTADVTFQAFIDEKDA